MRKKKLDFDKDFPHGSICFDCATKRGGKIPAGNCNTVSLDECPYCKKQEGLFSIRDFNWRDYAKKAVWD